MVEEQLLDRGIKDLRVAEVMSRVPRHLFVEESLQHKAYGDHPLPIGGSQTISQPFVVARMTEALQLGGREKVLEIGTGSGYQTAVLAELAEHVCSVERIRTISLRSQRLLEGLGYTNIACKVSDGTLGWREQSPFDAILITASSPQIPDALIQQLGEKGRLVCPVGSGDAQELICLTKNNDKIVRSTLGACKFVPLIGKYGWPDEKD